MEDRCHPGLWLELSQLDGGRWSAERAPLLRDRPGVVSVSWWDNAHPDRRDLPRRLDEFALLGVAETTAAFEPPETPAGVVGLRFTRTPRPGQGVLTGLPTIGLSLVLISPRSPHQAQDLRDWGDFVHIRHIAEAAVPGYGMITPYQREGSPTFLHLYEICSDDPEAVFKSMTPLVRARLDDDAYRDWERHPALRIDYVNTFRRAGVA